MIVAKRLCTLLYVITVEGDLVNESSETKPEIDALICRQLQIYSLI